MNYQAFTNDSLTMMCEGKWFNVTKGYGFIKPAENGPDVFVHISAVQKAGYSDLVGGARISYELVPNRSGKTSAENLRLG
jgi:cold shock protein